MKTKLLKGNNIDLLKTLEDNSIDSIITDPPYGLAFMNKKWDYDVPSIELWKEVYRVLKPGGHILSFGGTRTYHRMVVNIEDAGFEIRDCIQWIYGSGFPKSLNIGKSMDEYEGWGTGLKPANEPIVMARKPIDQKTIVENVKEWGTGGINIDGCRITLQEGENTGRANKNGDNGWKNSSGGLNQNKIRENNGEELLGRFPANVILECTCDEVIKGEKGQYKYKETQNGGGWKNTSDIKPQFNFNDTGDIHTNPDCPCFIMDEQSGECKSTPFSTNLPKIAGNNIFNGGNNGNGETDIYTNRGYNDKGGASRFFYVAKVSKKERNMGLDGFEDKENYQKGNYGSSICKICGKTDNGSNNHDDCGDNNFIYNPSPIKVKNNHPTVKPINLLTYLIRLITPPNGVVLDMYMGSGSTGIAALLEGKQFIGMEMDEEYFNIAEARINNYEQYRQLLKK